MAAGTLSARTLSRRALTSGALGRGRRGAAALGATTTSAATAGALLVAGTALRAVAIPTRPDLAVLVGAAPAVAAGLPAATPAVLALSLAACASAP